MANFYLDNPSLKHHLHHPLMERIVELLSLIHISEPTRRS